MPTVTPFFLEDFFSEFEFASGLHKLASSDALPWRWKDVMGKLKGMRKSLEESTFAYPDVARLVREPLEAFCSAPTGAAVLPTNGGAEAIYLALQAVQAQRRKTVRLAVPQPCFGSFDGIARILGIKLCSYQYSPNSQWQLDEQSLHDAVRKSDFVIVNRPHNPTGSVLPFPLVRRLADELASRGGALIIDEVFSLPDADERAMSLAKKAIVLGSLSKVYGLPGLRFGWIAGPTSTISTIRTIQQYTSLSINMLAANLAKRVLSHPEEFARRGLLETNRLLLRDWASKRTGTVFVTSPVGGTTVVFDPRVRAKESELFETFKQNRVLLVPGKTCFRFGKRPWFRLGYGCETATLRKGLAAIDRTLKDAADR
jgi:aspartate/methionine/tyrosine aminotransferase